MNKLSEAFKKSRKSDGGRPLGFAPSNEAKHRSILVGVHAGSDAASATTAIKAGADFAVVHTDDGTSAASAISAAEAGDAFIGAHVGTLREGEGEKLAEAGCGFIVVDPAQTSAAEADQDDVGLVIPVDISAEDSALQTLARLDPDAVVVPEEIGEITLSRRAALLRTSALTGKRLFVKTGAGITSADLKVLRDSGVGAVIVPDSTSEADLTGLIRRIEDLPARKSADDDGRPISLGHQAAPST